MSEQKTIDKKTAGIYNKFVVKRVDGRDAPGQKHDGCEYFVLDLVHDPHAMQALLAYADSCDREYPNLARDLRTKVGILTSRYFDGPHAGALNE